MLYIVWHCFIYNLFGNMSYIYCCGVLLTKIEVLVKLVKYTIFSSRLEYLFFLVCVVHIVALLLKKTVVWHVLFKLLCSCFVNYCCVNRCMFLVCGVTCILFPFLWCENMVFCYLLEVKCRVKYIEFNVTLSGSNKNFECVLYCWKKLLLVQ